MDLSLAPTLSLEQCIMDQIVDLAQADRVVRLILAERNQDLKIHQALEALEVCMYSMAQAVLLVSLVHIHHQAKVAFHTALALQAVSKDPAQLARPIPAGQRPVTRKLQAQEVPAAGVFMYSTVQTPMASPAHIPTLVRADLLHRTHQPLVPPISLGADMCTT